MTPEQTLNEVRVALSLDDRLATLLRQVAKAMADGELRALYGTNDPSLMIRQTGMAQGIEKFVVECTRPPKRGSAANAEDV